LGIPIKVIANENKKPATIKDQLGRFKGIGQVIIIVLS
jgi:hypothetical protein